jgi:hypothetical protein
VRAVAVNNWRSREAELVGLKQRERRDDVVVDWNESSGMRSCERWPRMRLARAGTAVVSHAAFEDI